VQQTRADAIAVDIGLAHAAEPQARVCRQAAEHELDVGHIQPGPGLYERVQAARNNRARPRAEHIGPDHARGHSVKAHLAMEATR
jgi:hypothetical protein